MNHSSRKKTYFWK